MNREIRKARGANFLFNRDGNAIMIFGLSLLPVMLMLGATLDFTRFTTTRAALQQAVDSAALMVASRMSQTTSNAQAKAQVQVILNSMPRMAYALVTSTTLSDDKQTFCANAEIVVPNTFMQLAHITSLTPKVQSCANLAGGVDPNTTYEIALVLDNSGSMSSSAGGKSKMQALRDAATSFVNTMFSKVEQGKLKMSITPFNAAVRAVDPGVAANRTASWIDTQGNSSLHWNVFGGKAAANAAGFTNRFKIFDKLKARRADWDWNGCFEGPPYPMNVSDAAPSASDPDTLFVPYLSPDEPDGCYNNSNGNYASANNNNCASNTFKYKNSYLNNTSNGSGDNPGGGCTGASSQWDRLNKVCKYNSTTVSLNTSVAGPDGFCTGLASQTLMRLASDKSVVVNKVASLVEGGNTNIHEGTVWGWRTISPNAPFADGAPYGGHVNRKVMIIMTDGANFWESSPRTAGGATYQALGYYSYNGTANTRLPDGSAGDGVNHRNLLKAAAPNNSTNFQSKSRDAQDALTKEACTNAKNAGIEIFTIGFSTKNDPIDEQGLALMKACATNDEHYFKAEDSIQLDAAFASIGIGLGKLRLSL